MNSNTTRVFICQITTDNYLYINKYISFAAHKFCSSLIEATKPHFVFSLIPIYITERIFSQRFKIIQLPFLRKNTFTKPLAAFAENFILFKHLISSKPSNIWFYNITPHTFIAYYLVRLFTRKKVFIIVADHSHSNKNIIWILIKLGIRSSNGYISLSKETQERLPHKNAITISGIIKQLKPLQKGKIERKKVLFSGALNEFTGICLVLETFKDLPNIDLYITGRGFYQSKVQEFANFYSNIHYLDFLLYEEYIEILNDIDICISARNPNLVDNSFNFPSKILEYLEYNKIIISTMHYPDFLFSSIFYCEYDTVCLKNKLEEVLSSNDIELLTLIENSRKDLINNFGYQHWEKSMKNIEENAYFNCH